MAKKGILSAEIVSSVWKALSDKEEEVSDYLLTNEPAASEVVAKMKEDSVDILLKIRSAKSETLPVEVVVDKVGQAFFVAGAMAMKYARDIADQKEVPKLKDYIQDRMTEELDSQVSTSVAKRRQSTK